MSSEGKDQIFKYPVEIGIDNSGKPFSVSAYDLQGLNIIVGLKGTGKSHLAKAILLGLTKHRGGCLVLDINDEYSRLYIGRGGKPKEEYQELFVTLKPGGDLKFPLPDIKTDVLVNIMEALGLKDASLAEFSDIVKTVKPSSLKKLKKEVKSVKSASVKNAILRRIKMLEDTKLIDDKLEEGTLENLLSQLGDGKTLVVNLKGLSKVTMRTTVQVLLSNITSLLEKRKLEPIFLFAEEAQMYIERTDIEDLVTRMRHLGIWQFYITNTPTSLPELLVRQTDNLFCFYLSLPDDVKYIAPASGLEPEILQKIVAALSPRRFLAVGRVTENYPIALETMELDVVTAGKTRLRFERP